MSAPRLLLVEDDAAVAEVVAFHLRGAGYELEHAADGHQALHCMAQQCWDLVLLDVMLPGPDGFEICRRLRAPRGAAGPQGAYGTQGRLHQGCLDGPPVHVPIIMLSARNTEAERVLGLELGADDYLAKPFSMLELTARVRALLRRMEQIKVQQQMQTSSPVLQAGSLHMDVSRRTAHQAGQPLNLTLREFDLLHFLARHPGHIYSRSELLQRVWGAGFDGFEHTVNSHINRLRSKLEGDRGPALMAPKPAALSPRLIETVWGLGYRFNVPGLPLAPAAAHT